MAMLSCRTTTCGPMIIRAGDGDIPVVLIHGSGSGARQMHRLAQLLVAAQPSLKILIPELHGYGGAAAPGVHNPIEAHLSILSGVVEDLAQSCYFIGHSMGGFLALKLSALLTATTGAVEPAGVVAIEPTAFGVLLDGPDDAVRQEDRDILLRMSQAMATGRQENGIACFIEYWNQTPWSEIPAPVRSQLVAIAPQIQAEAAAVSTDPTGTFRINAPVHLMCGGRSPVPAQRIVERLAAALTPVTLEWVADAGHMSVLRTPEKYLPGILHAVTD